MSACCLSLTTFSTNFGNPRQTHNLGDFIQKSCTSIHFRRVAVRRMPCRFSLTAFSLVAATWPSLHDFGVFIQTALTQPNRARTVASRNRSAITAVHLPPEHIIRPSLPCLVLLSPAWWPPSPYDLLDVLLIFTRRSRTTVCQRPCIKCLA